MDTTNASNTLHRLDTANKIAIADLNPEISDPASRAVRGVVTITWPYNSVKGTFAFILAEPDYRLRRNKGQVRVNLNGASAKAAGESGLSSGDEVLLSLDGAEWELEQVKKRQSLPGAGIDWQLQFSDKFLAQVTLIEAGESRLINVDRPPPPLSPPTELQNRTETPSTEIVPEDLPPKILEALTPPSKTYIAKLKDGEYESPAFVKRARMSYGSLFEDGYDIFEDDGGVRGRGRKRSRFGRESGAWKYTSQSPSPEPTSPSMADEGCQTMEIDLPMPLSVQTSTNNEPQSSFGSTSRVEYFTHPHQGMVDHGVQGDVQGDSRNEWPVTTPSSLLPPGVGGELRSSGLELPTFHSTNEIHVPNDVIQQWDTPRMNLPPEGYLHPNEPSSTDIFPNNFEARPSAGHDVIGSGSHVHSPNETDHLAIEHGDHHLSEGPATDEQGYPVQVPQHNTDYPPLGLEDEEESTAVSTGAHIDYPPSYLDNNHPFPQEAMDIGHGSFSTSVPVSGNLGSSSWAAVNNQSPETSMSHTGRLSSAEGKSPDTAVVIDESDSDDEPPPPTAAEDTVMTGQADPLEMYDEAEVEDEVDAEYSDEDEPEYDQDEIGGDYDTRKYTAPDDDEDDSHDEDLQPHELEPEFDDGESWDEGDEDAENLDYESAYETDDNGDEDRKPVRPASQAAPQVIDLISSSEDEGDDDEVTQPEAAQLVSNSVLQIQSKATPENIPKQGPNRVAESENESESEEDADDRQDNGEHNDEENEEEMNDIEGEEDAESADLSGKSESEPSERELQDEDMEEVLEEELEEEFEELEEVAPSAEDSDGAESIDHDSKHTPVLTLTSRPSETMVHRKSSPEPSDVGLTRTQDDEERMDVEGKEEKGDRDAPQSAAEGLEILSRAVENESSNDHRAESPGRVQYEHAADAVLSRVPEPLEEPKEAPNEEIGGHESDNAPEDEEMVDMVPILPAPASTTDEKIQAEVTSPSSPSLTQSFVSLPTGDKSTDVVLRETTAGTGSQTLADQLPTPRDTQLTGDNTVLESATVISMDVDAPDAESNAMTLLSVAEQVVNKTSSVVEDAVSDTEEQSAEPTTDQLQQTRAEEIYDETTQPKYPLHSPNLSFQTQVDADDMASASFVESITEIVVEPETRSDTPPDVEASISRPSLSFISQMEIDEELQASIMENSEFDEDTDVELIDEHEIHNQVEDYDGEASSIESEDEVRTEVGNQDLVSREPSPDLGTQIEDQRDTTPSISADVDADSPQETSPIDPSVQLARIANYSKRKAKNNDVTKITSSDERNVRTLESSSPNVEDSSVQLARASVTRSSSQGEDESYSTTAAKLKLMRHLRDELPDCTPLKVLRQHLQKKLDVIAVAMMHPPDPQRAKGGPREFMMSFTITDHSIGPYSVVEAQLYRPHKETLPIVRAGDIVLLRNFTAVSLPGKGFGLRTNDESSWAIFDHDGEPPQIKGPPVEYSDKETTYVAHMRAWYNLLDEKARTKLERANKKIIDAGKSK
ncbi:uncharacterized protein F4812DRAFT_434049 [Daldinia caldariorum]|uniref:uncharacterized protein n=1 Tax=Daldinia caldariorum TaxID=326644 RepID=UPI0020079B78|nr:uncharacterized protein F4812DRAFT_434049 [Daldinia caldariorum]KAI1466430.1 hypothetical protein F4812DRAFT_434049 [Daldinia caldariorum]